MTHLGTIEGIGRLIVGSDDVCGASYRISVFQSQPSGLKTAEGTLFADQSAMWDAFNRGDTRLRLEDGNEVDIIIKRLGDSADIIVNGPVPGF